MAFWREQDNSNGCRTIGLCRPCLLSTFAVFVLLSAHSNIHSHPLFDTFATFTGSPLPSGKDSIGKAQESIPICSVFSSLLAVWPGSWGGCISGVLAARGCAWHDTHSPHRAEGHIWEQKHKICARPSAACCQRSTWEIPPLRYVKSPPVGTTSGALAFQPVESESWHGKLHLQFPARSYKGQAQLWTSTAVLKVPFLHGENPKKGTRLLWWPAEKEPRYHWDCLGHTGGKQRVRKSQCWTASCRKHRGALRRSFHRISLPKKYSALC